jgi:hypothetical protein
MVQINKPETGSYLCRTTITAGSLGPDRRCGYGTTLAQPVSMNPSPSMDMKIDVVNIMVVLLVNH